MQVFLGKQFPRNLRFWNLRFSEGFVVVYRWRRFFATAIFFPMTFVKPFARILVSAEIHEEGSPPPSSPADIFYAHNFDHRFAGQPLLLLIRTAVWP
jgi:hypothetical protein